MGAELGETIATTRSATTELPNPIFNKVWSILPPTEKPCAAKIARIYPK
jgi:hypothetical protein